MRHNEKEFVIFVSILLVFSNSSMERRYLYYDDMNTIYERSLKKSKSYENIDDLLDRYDLFECLTYDEMQLLSEFYINGY